MAAKPHVVHRWYSSPITFGLDSRDRKENPDYHRPIGLTSDGRFVDEGDPPRDIPTSEIPQHILEAASKINKSIIVKPLPKQKFNFGEAMVDAGVADPTGSVPAREVKRGRGRPRKNAA